MLKYHETVTHQEKKFQPHFDPVFLLNPKPLINLLQDQGIITPRAACATVRAQEQVCSNMIAEPSKYPKTS